VTVDTSRLPDRVVAALGQEAAADLVEWIDQRLRAAEPARETQITAREARQKINVLMLEQVSNLLLADEPTLVEAENGRLYWRVPVDLTLPGQGRVGQVGSVDVDTQYGYTNFDSTTRQLFEQACVDLYQVAHLSETVNNA
jgi:hypothetical protein